MKKSKLILVWILILILIGAIVIFQRNISQKENIPQNISYSSVLAPLSLEEQNSILGVGYMAKQEWIPALYADAGIKWIKAADIDWSKVEPKAPINGKHNYITKDLDNYIIRYQKQGFNIQLILKSDAPWAVDLGEGLGGDSFSNLIKSAPPKQEYLNDYYNFVYHLIERYDGDGINDMPGLLKPILYFEIESEVQHPFHWNRKPEQYIELLKLAYSAKEKANPDSKIIHAGINFGDVYDDFPNETLIEQRVSSLDPVLKEGVNFVKITLKEENYYDLVEVHYNRGIYGLYGQVNEIRKYTNKPIWGGDTSTGPWMFTTFTSPFGNREESTKYFIKIRDKIEPEYSNYEKLKSETVVKKVAIAAELGVERLNFETTNQWEHALKSNQVVDQIWYILAMANNNGKPYPVYYTLKQLSEKIDGFKNAERIGEDYIYRFEFENKDSIFVAWSEEGNKTIDLSDKLGNVTTKIIYLINSIDDTHNPLVRENITISASNISLSTEPIFIEII